MNNAIGMYAFIVTILLVVAALTITELAKTVASKTTLLTSAEKDISALVAVVEPVISSKIRNDEGDYLALAAMVDAVKLRWLSW